MPVNNPQSADRAYKFMYKRLDIKFHRYFYQEGEYIEFIETEIPETGQRKDMVVKVDGKTIKITEFMATPLGEKKMRAISDYHRSSSNDLAYKDFEIQSDVISIAEPGRGITIVKIDKNTTFHVDPIFTKNKNGWKVLSTLIYKTIIHEELTDEEAIDLLILPDMNIKLPIETLMKVICFLIGHANIPDADFRRDIILCEIKVLERFFKNEKLSVMIEMLQTQTQNPEVARIIEKYGLGFDTIYFDGKADGIRDAKIEDARNLLADGFDEDAVSRCIGLSMDEIRKLKRKL